MTESSAPPTLTRSLCVAFNTVYALLNNYTLIQQQHDSTDEVHAKLEIGKQKVWDSVQQNAVHLTNSEVFTGVDGAVYRHVVVLFEQLAEVGKVFGESLDMFCVGFSLRRSFSWSHYRVKIPCIDSRSLFIVLHQLPQPMCGGDLFHSSQ